LVQVNKSDELLGNAAGRAYASANTLNDTKEKDPHALLVVDDLDDDDDGEEEDGVDDEGGVLAAI
jgi:hypothetical protein